MPMDNRKYHYIYKTTNIITNCFYIGLHSTNNIRDGYFGSGDRMRSSLRHYGKENHKFEILEFLENRKLLMIRESEIVNKELLKNPLCLNIMQGGYGFRDLDHMKKVSKAGNEKLKELLRDPEYKKEFALKTGGAETWKKLHREGKVNYDTFSGKFHSKEAKKSIGEKNSITQSGESNSQFGKMWVRNPESKETIKINQSELEHYLESGWERGRLIEVPKKLSEETVKVIKIKLAEGLDCVKISKLFSTSPSTVKSIKWGNSWNHVKL
jgi:hypothetical protein